MEVVSKNHPEKDYVEAPAKYACLGTRELVIFDPDRHGPAGFDHLFQVWRRDESASMVRVHAGDGPAYSEELGAWLFVTEGGVLRVADHADGSGLWLTAEESEAAARREEAAARAQAEAALLATLRTAVVDLCEAYDVPLDESRRVYLVTLDRDSLESLRAHIKYSRDWPTRQG